MPKAQMQEAPELVPPMAEIDHAAAELRERVITEARRRGYASDVPEFEKYETWCAERHFTALPVSVENMVSYLLELAADGAQKHVITNTVSSIERVHMMTNQQPRHLTRQALNPYFRALAFAKGKLTTTSPTERDLQAPAKAIEMFPGGAVPMRWSEVA